ncbi:TOBE domain-containing protein [uncultured Desulfovibrio sp.]|uniref:TOBE domain-containing protein n=1 Tax=uncultured Desulfovibrio sp. TaxID=167968 RepID=UPI00260C7255|nr:TOBE domain-containing protein [uncultured Desulfovibrio sp.]
MQTSARNVFQGTVTAIHSGAVNDEIIMALPGGQEVVASITQASTKRLGLAVGKPVTALVKASFVILLEDAEGWLLSTRNQFAGTVKAVRPGAVNTEVDMDLPGGLSLCAIVTMDSAQRLKLAPGSKVTAAVKASHVILAVEK